MNAPVNGHHSMRLLDELRAAKHQTANSLFIAIKHLEAAHATAQAHALAYVLPPIAPLQATLDLINKDISDRGNTP